MRPKYFHILLLAALLTFSPNNIEAKQSHTSEQSIQRLNRQLSRVYRRDQAPREELLTAQKSGNQHQIIKSVLAIQKGDEQNRKVVFRLLNKRGWVDGLSDEANSAIWLVIQHSDASSIERYRTIVQSVADRGDISIKEVKTMEDRLLVYNKKPQQYGTQTKQIGQQIVFYPIADFSTLDSRRQSIGLCNLSEYIEQLKQSTGREVIIDSKMTFERLDELQKQSPSAAITMSATQAKKLGIKLK